MKLFVCTLTYQRPFFKSVAWPGESAIVKSLTWLFGSGNRIAPGTPTAARPWMWAPVWALERPEKFKEPRAVVSSGLSKSVAVPVAVEFVAGVSCAPLSVAVNNKLDLYLIS